MENYSAKADCLKDKIILVTGASQGIGSLVAKAYAAHGATVILLARNTQKLIKVYDEIESLGFPQPALYPFNLETATPEDYQELADNIDKHFGRLDGLLHNAGILGALSPIEHYPLELWHRVLQVNLHAAFILTQCLMPLLKRSKRASIIFTSAAPAVVLENDPRYKIIPLETSILKAKALYGLRVTITYPGQNVPTNNQLILLEWQTNHARKTHGIKQLAFNGQSPGNPAYQFLLDETERQRLIADRTPIPLMQWETVFDETRKRLLKRPHVTLDNRRKYRLIVPVDADVTYNLCEMNAVGTTLEPTLVFHFPPEAPVDEKSIQESTLIGPDLQATIMLNNENNKNKKPKKEEKHELMQFAIRTRKTMNIKSHEDNKLQNYDLVNKETYPQFKLDISYEKSQRALDVSTLSSISYLILQNDLLRAEDLIAISRTSHDNNQIINQSKTAQLRLLDLVKDRINRQENTIPLPLQQGQLRFSFTPLQIRHLQSQLMKVQVARGDVTVNEAIKRTNIEALQFLYRANAMTIQLREQALNLGVPPKDLRFSWFKAQHLQALQQGIPYEDIYMKDEAEVRIRQAGITLEMTKDMKMSSTLIKYLDTLIVQGKKSSEIQTLFLAFKNFTDAEILGRIKLETQVTALCLGFSLNEDILQPWFSRLHTDAFIQGLEIEDIRGLNEEQLRKYMETGILENAEENANSQSKPGSLLCFSALKQSEKLSTLPQSSACSFTRSASSLSSSMPRTMQWEGTKKDTNEEKRPEKRHP